jgi:hypothetical protein
LTPLFYAVNAPDKERLVEAARFKAVTEVKGLASRSRSALESALGANILNLAKTYVFANAIFAGV